jgi:UDP-4-amino-4,6-dideoxy-N-acetyl-beta-L-altrosamine N-acetyltransferase
MREDLKRDMEISGVLLKNFIGLSDCLSEMVLHWRNHDQVRSCMLEEEPIPPEEHNRFLQGLAGREDCLHYLCFYEGAPLGVVNLTRISFRHQRASWGIYRQPGNALPQAGFLMAGCALSLAFDFLHLHTLQSEILATNRTAILLNQSLGFKKEGVLREYVLHGSRFLDLVLLSVTAEEYRGTCD